MNRPLIGVIPLVDIEKNSYWMLPGYLEGLINAGGMPVMLPLTNDQMMLREIADQFDGFLFTGGHDLSPALYGEQRLPSCGVCCELRDQMESELFPFIWEQDKPILGICRGLQFINVALGGTLYQDLPEQIASDIEHRQQPPYEVPVHDVQIVENSPLHMLLHKNSLLVNSHHHQAIKTLSHHLQPMAYSPDGLIEAIYAPEKQYVWAVQWHPEWLYATDENSRNIFKRFLSAMA